MCSPFGAFSTSCSNLGAPELHQLNNNNIDSNPPELELDHNHSSNINHHTEIPVDAALDMPSAVNSLPPSSDMDTDAGKEEWEEVVRESQVKQTQFNIRRTFFGYLTAISCMPHRSRTY
ncbi:hypothetical protein KEM48_004167 [Puccinia striiformis f. sp. tritici PST-130]|nr:hypothetical protein KEM48_004167 [Puccinia striiformis f. sp. tritici PST-130]